jgi:uncharacterized protein HemX
MFLNANKPDPGDLNNSLADAQPGAVHQPSPPKHRNAPSAGVSNGGWYAIIAAALLLLICAGAGVAMYIGAQKAKDVATYNVAALSASAKARQFCQNYELQTYGPAYQMFSKAAQGRVSQTQFASRQAAVDASAGNVVTCTVDSDHSRPSVSSDGKTATIRLQVVRGPNAQLTTGTLTLVYEDSEWKVDSADSSLKLL